MTPTSIERIRKRLASDPELRLDAARETGIPLQTIRNFACGITKHPRFDTFAPLATWFGKLGR